MLINTLFGPMEESQLQKVETSVDNEIECTSTVEYCLLNCEGQAHRTGIPDGDGRFCANNVHRSVNMHLKTGVFAAGVAADFGG